MDYRPLPILMRSALAIFSALLSLLAMGCAPPNQENIRLRKINQDLTEQIASLQTQNDSQKQTIAGLEKRLPTIPTLPPQEWKNLWVTGGLSFGSLSHGIESEPNIPRNGAFRAFMCPIDENGLSIQAAGSFVVEAFDLAEPGDNRLGRWTWDTVSAKSRWRSSFLIFGYDLVCPWQKIVPKHPDITVRVTFTDELTHIPYLAETVIQVDLPVAISTTAPTTSPAP
jgi:hypothetical protein